MKKLLLLLPLLVAFIWPVESYAQVKAGTAQVTVVNASLVVPVQLSSASGGLWVHRATIQAKKSPRAVNAGTVYIGAISTDDQQPFDLAPGQVYVIEAVAGTFFNLGDYYLDVTIANDGVVVTYQ
jgi:hypothetical protein